MSPNELSELVPLAKTLNEESNDLNKTISALSAEIAALNLGIEVWHPGCEDHYQVGFAKVSSGNSEDWKLAIRSKMQGSIWNDPYSLLQASRDLRIEGLSRVPALLNQMKGEALDKIRVMQDAKKLAAELSKDKKERPDKGMKEL